MWVHDSNKIEMRRVGVVSFEGLTMGSAAIFLDESEISFAGLEMYDNTNEDIVDMIALNVCGFID